MAKCFDNCACGRHKRLPLSASVVDRLRRQTVVLSSGCWEWRGAKTQDGYGRIIWNGVRQPIHRVAYEIFIGGIPLDKEIDHVSDRGCVSRACWNPDHLEAVTHRENCLRGNTVAAVNAAKESCPKGHLYAGENLYFEPKSGSRRCRRCDYENNRRRRLAAASGRVADHERTGETR